jgi:hypothetical protein
MKKFIVFMLLLIASGSVPGQTCGFGCLGLSGFYGGYSAQFYDMTTLNNLLSEQLSQLGFENSKIKFETGYGARIGANIFRAKFDKYFLTAKGFYQFLREESEVRESGNSNVYSFESKLELDHWGLGLDFGIPVLTLLDWKIVEGGVTFYRSKLENTYSANDFSISDNYEEDKINIGYYVGTGLIIHIIKDYISLEGTAVYNNVDIGNLLNNQGDHLLDPESGQSIMDNAGVTATVQLNIGVPL